MRTPAEVQSNQATPVDRIWRPEFRVLSYCIDGVLDPPKLDLVVYFFIFIRHWRLCLWEMVEEYIRDRLFLRNLVDDFFELLLILRSRARYLDHRKRALEFFSVVYLSIVRRDRGILVAVMICWLLFSDLTHLLDVLLHLLRRELTSVFNTPLPLFGQLL